MTTDRDGPSAGAHFAARADRVRVEIATVATTAALTVFMLVTVAAVLVF